jgi:hypothetical protein
MMTTSSALLIESAEDLRRKLDELNEAGVDHKVAGIDAKGQPFLATLTGVYAEGMIALTYDPRDTDVSGMDGPWCGDCGTALLRPGAPLGLNFPVTALVPVNPAGTEEQS